MDIEIRIAQPDDKGPIAELMHSSGMDLYGYLYGDRAIDYLRYEFSTGNGFAGYRNITVAVCNNEVVGAGCFFGATDYKKLVEGTIANMTAFFGEENVMPVLMRAHHAASVMKPPREREVYLSNFGVSETLRGQGIGSKIIQHAINRAKHEGYTIFGLDVSTQNPRGQALYTKLGLKVVEEKVFSVEDAGVAPSRKMEMALS